MVKYTITSTTVNCGINKCPHKLPCGICRLTMTMCPMSGHTITSPIVTLGMETMVHTEDVIDSIAEAFKGKESE